jgi:hypothetical protein
MFLLFLPGTIFAQSVSGTVYELHEGHKHPLPGVNIFWAGTDHGTASDANGHFEIENDHHHHALVFSFVGYKTDTVHVENGKNIEVVLSENRELGEVTVVEKNRGNYISQIDPIYTQKINGHELHKAACCNLSESFETNASVDVSYNDAVTGAKQIKLLGLSGLYTSLQTENYPNLRGLATNYGLTYIPGPWMESIQVSKGASSVINGYESITGQINVEYKKPDSDELLHLNLFAGDDSRLEFNANSGIKLSDHLSTGIFFHAEDNSKEIDHNHDGFLDHPLTEQYHFINRWQYAPGTGYHALGGINLLTEERLGGQLGYKKGGAQNPGLPYGTSIDNQRAEFSFKNGYAWDEHRMRSAALISNAVLHRTESVFGKNRYNADETNLYANLIFSSLFAPGSELQYIAGLSYYYDKINQAFNAADFSNIESVPGLFVEWTYKKGELYTVMAGVRADFHNLFGTFYTPRFHFRYAPSEHLILRASAGKGYRTANLIAENNYLLSSSRSFNFNDELMQENAWNFGASAVQTVHLFNRELSIGAEFYRTSFTDQLVVDMENSATEILFYPLNGKSYANSYQVDLSYQPVDGLDITLAYRGNEVKQTIGGELLEKPLTSRYKGLVTLNYTTPNKGWMFDYTLQLNGGGRIPQTPGAPEAYDPGNEFPSFTVMNAQVTKYFKRWSIYAGAENLTNFTMNHPVIGAEDPYGPWFDATKVWGPVLGRKIYAGIRFTLNRPANDHDHDHDGHHH